MTVAALVLAAGASSRFGSPKALAQFEGRPLLEHVLDAVREAGIDEIVVVLGHAADEIEAVDPVDAVAGVAVAGVFLKSGSRLGRGRHIRRKPPPISECVL